MFVLSSILALNNIVYTFEIVQFYELILYVN